MAIVDKGIAGPVIGRVGPVVGYMWKRTNCLRTYVEHIHYPNTVEQQRQRDWFVGMVRFASTAHAALKLGLAHEADQAGMTEGNLFVLMNKAFFVRENDTVNVDYSRLQIAQGPAADVYFRQARFEEGETVEVEFEKNSLSLRASGDDSVYVYVYAPGLSAGHLSAPAARRSKRVRIKLPESWAGQEVHLYGFVVDKEGRPSRSTYIGVGRVNHYEYRGRYIPLNKDWKDFVDIANEANADSAPVARDVEVTEKDTLPTIDLFGDPPEVP